MTSPRYRASDALRIATWLGLATAWGETAARYARSVLLDWPLDDSYHLWWRTPLAEVLLFLFVAGLVLLIARLVPILQRRQPLVAILFFPAALTLLLFAERLHYAARLLLAAGLAIEAAALLGLRGDRFLAFVKRTLRPLALVTLAVGVAVPAWYRFTDWRAERALPPARAGAPNVLFLLWDTVRASELSVYGHRAPTTPELARFAERAVVFDRAMATAPYTLPSHASLFTGRWSHDLSANWHTALDAKTRTLAEALSAAGYRSGGFSANRFYVTRRYGLARGFTHFEEQGNWIQEVVLQSTLLRLIVHNERSRRVTGFADYLARVRAPDQRTRLLRWLEKSDRRPFFAFVNYMDAHAPFLPPAPYDTSFGWFRPSDDAAERRRLRLLAHLAPPDLPHHEALRQERAYEAAIANLDAETGRLLRDLEARGYLANTIVVIAADHGEEFGEHGVFAHGNSLYLQSLHVPLLVRYPGGPAGPVRVKSTVSMRDVPATILDLAGLQPQLSGRSLRPLWSPGEHPPEDADDLALDEVRFDRRLRPGMPVSKGDMVTAISDSLQLIRQGDLSELLFDLAANPEGGRAAPHSAPGAPRLRAALPPPRR